MKRKIVFITKSLCYHQVGIADRLYQEYGDEFAFIQMREPLDFRVKSKQEGFERPYLFGYAKDEESNRISKELLNNADVIIWGEASLKVMKHIKKDAIILKYSERIFKRGFYKTNFIHSTLNCLNLLRLKTFLHHRRIYLLSAGYYSSKDYNRFGICKKTSLRWGYFPSFENENIKKDFSNDHLQIIWVSRLLKWKHPEKMIDAARYLQSKNISFDINIVGDGDAKSGEMKVKMQKLIQKHNLESCVHMLGKVEPQKVLELYKRSHIAFFTSGPAEGWGVGLNEAMNYKNVVIASNRIGATNYLIKDRVNGFIYDFSKKKDFQRVIDDVLNSKDQFETISENAAQTIKNEWSCDEAVKRLVSVINGLMNKSNVDLYENGPCSIIGKK